MHLGFIIILKQSGQAHAVVILVLLCYASCRFHNYADLELGLRLCTIDVRVIILPKSGALQMFCNSFRFSFRAITTVHGIRGLHQGTITIT